MRIRYSIRAASQRCVHNNKHWLVRSPRERAAGSQCGLSFLLRLLLRSPFIDARSGRIVRLLHTLHGGRRVEVCDARTCDSAAPDNYIVTLRQMQSPGNPREERSRRGKSPTKKKRVLGCCVGEGDVPY